MTSPLGLSCVTAPAKVWHGVLTLSQELALLPERAETKTRLARARAGVAAPMKRTETQRPVKRRSSSRENPIPLPQEPAGLGNPGRPPQPVPRAYIGENGTIVPEVAPKTL